MPTSLPGLLLWLLLMPHKPNSLFKSSGSKTSCLFLLSFCSPSKLETLASLCLLFSGAAYLLDHQVLAHPPPAPLSPRPLYLGPCLPPHPAFLGQLGQNTAQWMPTTVEIHSLTVLVVRVKGSVGRAPSEGWRGGSFLPLPTAGSPSFPCTVNAPLHSASVSTRLFSLFPSVSPPPLIRTPATGFGAHPKFRIISSQES